MPADRFDHSSNLRAAGSYHGRRSAFWPPSDDYAITMLDLGAATPDLGDRFRMHLAELGDAVETQWRAAKDAGDTGRTRFPDPAAAAAALAALADDLPEDVDRTAAALRARALADGYDDAILQSLVGLEEDVVVVAGPLSTWYGKENAGLPSAFACRRDGDRQARVMRALGTLDEVAAYLARMHADLRLAPVPAFAVTDLFFMAGEGNLHPKHIAYFLPEDEGVRRSPFKKTYYFGNTHRALLRSLSGPLAARHLDVGTGFAPADPRFATIPTLGVLGHELGHCVHRPATRYKALNAADRWASVVLQEVMADVYGALVLADVWAEALGVDRADAIAYYLAECLRYTDRGLGSFPDSDGMFLQLSYFTRLGALVVKQENGVTRLVGEPDDVLAGLRSLARVLADAALTGQAEPAVALWRTFGPQAPSPLEPLIDELRARPSTSVEYLQEHLRPTTTTAL